jgi:molybdopterin converting factor subunit 1
MVKVLLFSVLRTEVGVSAVELLMDGPMTVGEMLDHLSSRYPPIRSLRSVIRVAVDQEYAGETDVVHDGDEVALITPVSGG